MKRTTTIVLFASIFAVAVGTLGLSGNSATSLMISAVPQTQESVGMLGHVEYKLMDSSGSVIKYMQGDNIVVNDGENCVAEDIFGAGTGSTCGSSGTSFNFIGIGNFSSGTVGAANSTLADSIGVGDTTGTCAGGAPGIDGDMARKPAVVTHTAANGATGAIVELDTSATPFSFAARNATVVFDSGIFNTDYQAASVTNECVGTDVYGSGGTGDMFARQLLNTNQGITVSDGDSLSVKWTITVG